MAAADAESDAPEPEAEKADKMRYIDSLRVSFEKDRTDIAEPFNKGTNVNSVGDDLLKSILDMQKSRTVHSSDFDAYCMGGSL